MGRQKWLSGFPELLTDDFSCHAYYMGIDVIRINSVLLAALNYLHTSQNKVSKYVIKKYFIISLFPPKIDIKLAS
ncbi:hypothetical protein KB20921_23980 [Edwardsiella ictaluri]|nr:hypothetical protein KH20906_23790 [Edwardsiella ictaluri]BEI03137.1 hypothetical protein KB20921_23980 [Edwardsiella ictaluri]BEI06598.1 hypothetical protein KH201010_23840 [Edwardsiella ictaluri]BEI10062.1 hypothetical protein STU22726_23930 [Edwardsiella ictaluri]BEI13541.1 hypothetical protein STU22816_23940 [Edwardsiella ictaluri]